MSYIEQTRERTFIEFQPGFLTNLIHIGKLHYTEARQALPLHQHKDILEICYVYRGNPIFQVGGEEYPLKGGDVFLSFPNEVHSTGKYPQDKMILYWLGIKIEGIDSNFMQFQDSKEANAFLQALTGLKARKFRGSKELKVLLDEVLNLYFSKHTFKKILIRNRITDFLALLIDFEKKSHDSGISPLIENSITYIRQNLSEQIKIENLCELAHLSIPRFKQRFKDETGVPPGEFMLRSKIEKASEVLSETTIEITTIAFDLGFSSSQYFATVFKRYTNCSPSYYRRIHKKAL
jgi:AraC-like DNA-binding protein